MSTRATGTFQIETRDEKPLDEQDGVKLTRTHLTKTFHGDIEGTCAAEMLMTYGPVEGSAAYTDFERVIASIHGRSGSFVLHYSEARISNEPDGGHYFSLDYDFEQPAGR